MTTLERLAITVWQGRISPVLDVSREAIVLEISDRQVISQTMATLPDGEPVQKIVRLSELQVQTLVCGAVSRHLAATVASFGIRLLPFVSGEVDTVVDAYLADSLPSPDLRMPGCRRQGRRFGQPWWQLGEEDNESQPQAGDQERKMMMPQQDGTGPLGQGPGTGRGCGPCGNDGAQQANRRGGGRGQGGGQSGGGQGGGGQGGGGQGGGGQGGGGGGRGQGGGGRGQGGGGRGTGGGGGRGTGGGGGRGQGGGVGRGQSGGRGRSRR